MAVWWRCAGKLENAQAEAKFGEGTELAEGDHGLQDKALNNYGYMKVGAGEVEGCCWCKGGGGVWLRPWRVGGWVLCVGGERGSI